MTEPGYAVIAGVNKAGTTSLFVSLSTHPEVCPSAIKETRYFLPVRYGRTLESASVWEAYFAGAPDRPLRLEATPSLFYGGAAMAAAMDQRLSDLRVVLLFREPVARAVSFFGAQKVRLRLPADMGMADYLAVADRLTDADFANPENEKYMAFRGGLYADHLPGWLDTLGRERVHIVAFEDLVQRPASVIAELATRLGLEPSRFPGDGLGSENRTTGYRSARFQRAALWGNDRLERVFRRHPDAKLRIRSWYYRINGRSLPVDVTDDERGELARRYAEPNARLAEQLSAGGYAAPPWLSPTLQVPSCRRVSRPLGPIL